EVAGGRRSRQQRARAYKPSPGTHANLWKLADSPPMYSESVGVPRAGVYGRESKGKTASVEDQLDRGAEACDDNGWALAGRWRDGVGASAKSRGTRKGWPEVRAAIEARDIDILVLWEGSRGARDMSAWVDLLDACRDHGVKVY